MSIELHIERLVIDAAVLDGERAGDVRAAIERELTRVLTRSGAAAALHGIGAIDRLPPALLPTTRHPRDSLGHRIVAAAGNGLGLLSEAVSPARSRAVPGAKS